jgi:hypothetical protein
MAQAEPTPSDPCRPRDGAHPFHAEQERRHETIKVILGEGERFADPQSGTPQDHDQRPESRTAQSVRPLA